MSHFLVAVFTRENGKSVKELLAPYDENGQVELSLKFSKQEAIDYARKHYYYFKKKTDQECWEYMADGYITDEEGNIYSTRNPNGHWASWEEGGRWGNLLRLKDGTEANSAKIKDIDFSPNQQKYQSSLRFWDIIVEHKPLEPGEKEPFSIYKESYYKDIYGNRETYARRQSQFYTWAVVDTDGIWHQCGNMSWFGVSDETPEEAADWEDNYIKNFIEGEDGDTIITIVDCHC